MIQRLFIRCHSFKVEMHRKPVAEFIDPDWEDKVNSSIGLSYRSARLHGLARAGTTAYAGVEFIPQSQICEFGY
jgi:hypothetical protein